MGKTTSPNQAKKASPAKGKPSSSVATKKKKDTTTTSSGKPADQVILEAMAKLTRKRGSSGVVEKKKLASVTKLNPKTMANAITKLKKKGLLEATTNANFQLTDKGREEVGGMDLLSAGGSTNKDVHDQIKQGLKGKAVVLFDMIADGEEHYKEEIAQSLGYTDKGKKQKGFMNLIASMKSEGILYYPSKDTVQLVKEECFPYDD